MLPFLLSIKRGLKKEFKVAPPHAIVFKGRLSWSEIKRLSLDWYDWDRVKVETVKTRYYPLAEKMSHVLGYVGKPSLEDQKAFPYSQKSPHIFIGKQGIERIFENDLSGKLGSILLEVNAKRKVVRELKKKKARSGGAVRLSLIRTLQEETYNILQNVKSGSIVVLHAQTGEVLSLASSPSFNPNHFTGGIPPHIWTELCRDSYKPLVNKALSGLYAPGSTIKMGVILAGLEAGLIRESDRIFCKGFTTVNAHRFHCWAHKKGGHGWVDARQALVRSCDVFLYEVAKKIGIHKLHAVFQELGLGSTKLDIFPESKCGVLPHPGLKKREKKGVWTVSDTLLTSIGQGRFVSTPLELAVMAARLASGRKVLPSLGGRVTDFPPLSFAPHHLAFIQKALRDTLNEPGGTAFPWRLTGTRDLMAGKTGTTQVRRISLEERQKGLIKNTDLPWHLREHALYVGFFPFERPLYALSVVVEHGGSGGATATPIARDVCKILADKQFAH